MLDRGLNALDLTVQLETNQRSARAAAPKRAAVTITLMPKQPNDQGISEGTQEVLATFLLSTGRRTARRY